MTPHSVLLEGAHFLGARGFLVHPCHPVTKRPLTRFLETATSDHDGITQLWERFPAAAIGVRTGAGLVVIDDDRSRMFPDPSLPRTTVVQTRSKGWHHWYAFDGPLPNSVGKLLPGVDVRGTSGYVIAPPSDGYDWHTGLLGLAPLPSAILAALTLRDVERRRSGGFNLREYVPAGERHAYLLSLAGWLAANDMVADRHDLEMQVLAHSLEVCEPPARMIDRERNVKSIAKWIWEREHGGR